MTPRRPVRGQASPQAPRRTPKLFIMIPTYNERENIGPLLADIARLKLPNLHVVVVDDDSPDGTGGLLDELVRTRPWLHLLHRRHERGRGTAGLDGFKYALSHGADLVVEMDADFSHHPRHLPELLAASGTCDVVVGSRFVPGGRDLDRGWVRHLITRLANLYIRRLLRLTDVHDCTSGYRLFHRRVLETVNLDNTISLGPSIVQELLYKAVLRGFTVREIPIVFVDRKHGRSTFNWRIMVQSVLMTLILKFLFSSLRRVEIHPKVKTPAGTGKEGTAGANGDRGRERPQAPAKPSRIGLAPAKRREAGRINPPGRSRRAR